MLSLVRRSECPRGLYGWLGLRTFLRKVYSDAPCSLLITTIYCIYEETCIDISNHDIDSHLLVYIYESPRWLYTFCPPAKKHTSAACEVVARTALNIITFLIRSPWSVYSSPPPPPPCEASVWANVSQTKSFSSKHFMAIDRSSWMRIMVSKQLATSVVLR